MNTYNVTFLNGSVTAVSLASYQYFRAPVTSSAVIRYDIVMGQEITMVETYSAGKSEAREDAITAYEMYKLQRVFS